MVFRLGIEIIKAWYGINNSSRDTCHSHFRIYLLSCIAILGQDIAILRQDKVLDKMWMSRG